VRTVEVHVWKMVSTHERDWDERLPILVLPYRASTHNTTGMTPANMVFGRELRLPYDLFGALPNKVSTTDYAANLAERLHDTLLRPSTPESGQ
jgi:hypothetical protein